MAALVFSLDLNSEQNPDHPMVKCCNGLFSTTGGWKSVMICEFLNYTLLFFLNSLLIKIVGNCKHCSFFAYNFSPHASGFQVFADRVSPKEGHRFCKEPDPAYDQRTTCSAATGKNKVVTTPIMCVGIDSCPMRTRM